MTSTAAWCLSSEALGTGHHFSSDVNEHIMGPSLRGNSGDTGEKDQVLLWIPFLSLLICYFAAWALLKSVLVLLVFIWDVTVHFCSKYIPVCAQLLRRRSQSLLNLWEESAGVLQAAASLLVSQQTLWKQSSAASCISSGEPASTA